jgi:hypothetical protein
LFAICGYFYYLLAAQRSHALRLTGLDLFRTSYSALSTVLYFLVNKIVVTPASELQIALPNGREVCRNTLPKEKEGLSKT